MSPEVAGDAVPGLPGRIVDALLALVYPQVCGLCGECRATRREGYVCGPCRDGVRFVRPPFCGRCGLPFDGEITDDFHCANCAGTEPAYESARAAVVARGAVLDAIHRYKYRGETWFGPFLTDLLLREATPVLSAGSWEGMVPVPLHPVKRRERGFNQAERLAAPLARALGIPVRTDLVRRVLPTRTQTRLNREERTVNVRRAFAPRAGMRAGGGDWIVFDDVLTTGATCGAVAAVLREGGARRVVVWSVARATLGADAP